MTFKDKLVENLMAKLGDDFEPSEEVADGIVQQAESMAGQVFGNLGQLDESIRSKVVLRLDAEPGWRRTFFNQETQKLTLYPVTKWALIGPTELPEWCRFNVSCMPIDDETGTVASFDGFLGVFGPDDGTDEEVIERVEAQTIERAAQVVEMILMQQLQLGLKRDIADLSQKVRETREQLAIKKDIEE